MVCSVCYPRHSIVLDRVKGQCKPGTLEALLHSLHETCDSTGTPSAVMAYAETPQAISAYLTSLADLTHLPLFIDSPSSEVRLAGARFAREIGIEKRCVYNTLNLGVTDLEISQLKETGVSSAVLLAFNPKDLELKGKIYLLEDGGGMLPDGLMEMASQAGITRPLIDTAVTAADQKAGSALRAIMVAKAKWGAPCGCALHNAIESVTPQRELNQEEKRVFRHMDTASSVMPILAGADFVMYGAIEYSRRVLPAAAFADAMMAQAAADL